MTPPMEFMDSWSGSKLLPGEFFLMKFRTFPEGFTWTPEVP